MIDHPDTVAPLLEQMQDQLPIPAFPTKEIVRVLRRGGVKARTDRSLSIKRVFYAGDEGGIVCDVTPSQAAKEVFIVSLTHLRIAPYHPLFPAIVAYQRQRVVLCRRGRIAISQPNRAAKPTFSSNSNRARSPEF